MTPVGSLYCATGGNTEKTNNSVYFCISPSVTFAVEGKDDLDVDINLDING